jgi:hypothetical protein
VAFLFVLVDLPDFTAPETMWKLLSTACNLFHPVTVEIRPTMLKTGSGYEGNQIAPMTRNSSCTFTRFGDHLTDFGF